MNIIAGKFPQTRLRRTRQFDWSRKILQENSLSVNDFILAVFICDGENIENELSSMPNVYIYSIDRLIKKLEKYVANGLKAIMLFPKTPDDKKSKNGDEAFNPENLTCRAIRAIKKQYKNLGIICDIALDPYTINGHDGITDENDYVLNDETVNLLCKQALNFCQAGCDILAPSDMMDGRIGAIRNFIDKYNMQNIQIMSYSIKFASKFYGPFRQSIGSAQQKPISKSTYQMDFCNSDEALREITQDIEEGADYIIIKPAMIYLDVIRQAKDNFKIPIVAYNVSGEYSMLMNGVQNGLFDKHAIFYETYMAMKRAGAKIIISYNFDLILEILEKFN